MRLQMAEIAFTGPRSNGITIRDAADRAAEVAEPQPELALDSAAEADLDFARQLQAKLDAQEARGGGGARSARLTLLTACPLHCHACLSAAAPLLPHSLRHPYPEQSVWICRRNSWEPSKSVIA